jgi:CTP synthase (UTP-ammonia lyase)
MRILALGDRDPAQITHRELDSAFALMPDGVECSWTATDSREACDLQSADGIWLLPGTPYRDDWAAYAAIEFCRTSGTPFLGTCGGFQYACVELARALAGINGASHAESDPDADDLVVARLTCSLYGERRTVEPIAGTCFAEICGTEPFSGFHWCGFGLDQKFEQLLERAGVVVGARAEDAGAEAIELPHHPFFIATAFQPQVGSSESHTLHPLIRAFVEASTANLGARRDRSLGSGT